MILLSVRFSVCKFVCQYFNIFVCLICQILWSYGQFVLVFFKNGLFWGLCGCVHFFVALEDSLMMQIKKDIFTIIVGTIYFLFYPKNGNFQTLTGPPNVSFHRILIKFYIKKHCFRCKAKSESLSYTIPKLLEKMLTAVISLFSIFCFLHPFGLTAKPVQSQYNSIFTFVLGKTSRAALEKVQ